MTRRDFLAHCTELGLSGAALAALQACVTKRHPPPRDEVAASAAGPLEGELRIFNWSDYVGATTIARFETEFGVRVSYDTYESNEEMIAKLVAGGGGYDIVGPTSYLIPVLVEGGLVGPLDHAVLPNWKNLLDVFANAPSDPGGRYSMPYQWGTTGIGYRGDRVDQAPKGWEVFADTRLRGKMTMLDNGREVLGAMLKWRGHLLNSRDPTELATAVRDAIAVKPNLRAYGSASVRGQLISGDVLAAQIWSTDALLTQMEESRVKYVIPSQGTEWWLDCLVIPRTAPNRRTAHAFMNYVLRPEIAAEIADATGGAPANREAIPLMKHPVSAPGPELLAKVEFLEDLGPAVDLWDRLWTEVKTA